MPKINIMKTKALLAVVLAVVFSGCISIQKLLDQGRYDEVVKKTSKKLQGKKVKDPEVVIALEKAFNKINELDLALINQLNINKDWREQQEILKVTQKIQNRQQLIRPLLPIVANNNYRANLNLIDTRQIEEMAKARMADDLYNEGNAFLDEAKNGDFKLARNAYERFNKLLVINSDYRDLNAKIKEALEIGQSHVLIKLINESDNKLPKDFERNIKKEFPEDMQSQWIKFYHNPVEREKFDYLIELIITDINVSGDNVSNNTFTYNPEIIDGYTITKDSLGNKIKTPKKIHVWGQITETTQHKDALIISELVLTEYNKQNILDQYSFNLTSVFDNKFTSFKGDKRALPNKWNGTSSGSFAMFPSNKSLILSAAASASPNLKIGINRFKKLL